MVKALIEIDKNTNRVLKIVRATYGLKDRGEAIKFMVAQYIGHQQNPELAPEFIKEIAQIKKQLTKKVDDFVKQYKI